ncbi:hypothetical protein TUM12370_18510 [Salmonella enterica subsp. enterica serovar Choleraesuis]|nr:hypothetical protein TUM12370_18510 [Salmonella enterica subsp. enterica serovar Choleraesuis]
MSGDDQWTHWPWLLSISESSLDTTELVGRKCRVIRHGESVTQEIEPGRVTIMLDAESRIAGIYIDSQNSELK